MGSIILPSIIPLPLFIDTLGVLQIPRGAKKDDRAEGQAQGVLCPSRVGVLFVWSWRDGVPSWCHPFYQFYSLW